MPLPTLSLILGLLLSEVKLIIFLPDDEAGYPRPIRPSAARRCSALRLELATALLESVCIGKIDVGSDDHYRISAFFFTP